MGRREVFSETNATPLSDDQSLAAAAPLDGRLIALDEKYGVLYRRWLPLRLQETKLDVDAGCHGLFEELDALGNEIIELPANTVQGFAVKATAALHASLNIQQLEDVWSLSEEDLDWDIYVHVKIVNQMREAAGLGALFMRIEADGKDPVFAAIENHREADANLVEACKPRTYDDAALLALRDPLLAAWRAEIAASKSVLCRDSPEADAVIESAAAKTRAVVDQIEHLEPTTLEGLCVQALALSWTHQGQAITAKAIGDQETTDLRLLSSIASALMEMQKSDIPLDANY